MHPASLQKVDKGAYLWESQSVAQRQASQWRGRTLISPKHNLQPAVSKKIGNLLGWYADEPDTCHGDTDQGIEVIGAKPRRNAHDSSCRAVLEAPFRHAWYAAVILRVLFTMLLRFLGVRLRVCCTPTKFRWGHRLPIAEAQAITST
jgi:hypothetical protein